MIDDTIRTWVEIRTNALVHNLKIAKKMTNKKVMCVIKGDAHGHGAIACAKSLEQNGADAFAVACLTEGIALRESGIEKPILILGWTPPEYANLLSLYSLAQSILDQTYAEELNTSAKSADHVVDVHIKLDTGMSRTGILAQTDPQSAAHIVNKILNLSNLSVKGIFTHLAAADMREKDDFTAWQLSNYIAVLKELKKTGFSQNILRHVANSAGILYHPETYFDMVRMGVMMYGLYPGV